MARCDGTTRSGDQCKRDAQPDSKFCYVHDPEKEQADGGDGDATAAELELMDLAPILLAGIMAAGLVFLLKGFGRWIPRF
ncbi:MAG: hypothetical protein MUO50_04665 [Longimicrobiales bacterium]|nr:hypothetical protein [Longimicrobiales bacterium]